MLLHAYENLVRVQAVMLVCVFKQNNLCGWNYQVFISIAAVEAAIRTVAKSQYAAVVFVCL